jgi:hypothetical protein
MKEKVVDTLVGGVGIGAIGAVSSLDPVDGGQVVQVAVQVIIGLVTLAKLIFPKWFKPEK